MPTTNVPKGANRAAAAAKTAKHAQRTPLLAKAQPVRKPARKIAPVKSLAGLLPSASKPVEKVAPTTPPALPANKAPSAMVVDGHKMYGVFKADAEASGWSVSSSAMGDCSDPEIEARAHRGDEHMEVRWHGSRFIEATYTYGARTVKLRNVSAARKQAAIPASQAKVVQPRPLRRGVWVIDAGPVSPASRKRLPFDAEKSSDAEVLAAVSGKIITWINSISGSQESARVIADGRFNRVKPVKGGRRVLDFASQGEGFRAVYLDAILAVRS